MRVIVPFAHFSLRIQPRCALVSRPFWRPIHNIANSANGQPIEEQTLPFYHERHYYPVRIGEIFKNRYSIIAKLGYGAYSTVWLGWDNKYANYPP